MKIEIKKRFTGNIMLCGEYESIKDCLKANPGIILSWADLSGADLSRANLYGTNLYGADLSWADLYGTNLYGADLSRANLYGTDLSRANLYGTNLSGADLSRANLYGTNLYGADLSGANLYGTKLTKHPVQVSGFKYDILVTESHFKIGCQVHTVPEWKKFTAKEIAQFDSEGVKEWKALKPVLMAIHKNLRPY